MERIVAIDPSLSCTGIVSGTISEDGLRYEESFRIITKPINSRTHRIHSIFKQTREIIVSLRPRYIVIEDYAFSRVGEANSITPLAETNGAIICASLDVGIEIFRISSMTWKSVVGWKTMPKITKADVTIYTDRVRQLFGFIIDSCDIADAWMIALAVKRIMYGKKKLSKGANEFAEMIREEIR